MSRALVLTTINAPNWVLERFAEGAKARGVHFVVIGDTKTPEPYTLDGVDYYSVERQHEVAGEVSRLIPVRHYARKNVGYLVAAAAGATLIQESDDDNIPHDGDAFWDDLPADHDVDVVTTDGPWLNAYALFSEDGLWPRGYPLEWLGRQGEITATPGRARGLILQGLADENPDVDAVFRLTRALPLDFQRRKAVMLAPGAWCPFNSQNTVFQREAFALLYLPAYCSFRMTDIWRSFVAQRVLWESGEGVVFHNATVYQERNEHDLLKDFEDEVPGYLHNDKIRLALDACRLDAADPFRSVAVCYEALVAGAFIPADETPVVQAWLGAMERAVAQTAA